MVLVATLAAGVAELTMVAARSTHAARTQSAATSAAMQRMEELRGLTWAFLRDASAAPVSDTTTDLSRDPPANGGGGMTASPARALEVNTPGYVDYLDAMGRWVGTAAVAPPGAIYVRRWSITPLPNDPADTVCLQVFVTTVASDVGRGPATRAAIRTQDDVVLATCRTRSG